VERHLVIEQRARLVLGLDLGLKGPRRRHLLAELDRLERRQLPVDLFDERLTSFEAEERLKELSGRRARDKGTVDAVAASIILEGWLNHRRASA